MGKDEPGAVARFVDFVIELSRSRRDECHRFSFFSHRVTRIQDMTGQNRAEIRPGLKVSIVLKPDQRSGKLTEGVVKDILTKSPTHPHGIKVRLESGAVGRVKVIH
jgi:uncharacterized repeat protein (TIGR03833 family)